MKALSLEFTSDNIVLYEQDISKNKLTVLKDYRFPMPPNSYVNRVLINNDRGISDAIRNGIHENGIKTKKVILTVADTDSMIEEFSMLKAPKKQLDGMVEQELRKRHKLNSDYIYDYIILGEDLTKEGFVNIQVTLCVKALVENAYNIIRKAGLIPYKFVSVKSAMERVAGGCRLLNAQFSSILAFITPTEAHYLYVGHSQESYYRYSKLTSEKGMDDNLFVLSSLNHMGVDSDRDEDIRLKVNEDLTRLSRFHSQRHPGEELENVFLYGSYEKMDELNSFLNDFFGGIVVPLRSEDLRINVTFKSWDEAICFNSALAPTVLWEDKDAQYDIFSRLEVLDKDNKGIWEYAMLMCAGVICIIVLIITGFQYSKLKELRRQNDEINDWLNDPVNVTEYVERNEKMAITDSYRAYNAQVETAIELLENMPAFNSNMVRDLDRMKPNGVNITGISFNDGVITLGCYSKDQYLPAEYAKKIKESGNYRSVVYNGFSGNRNSAGEDIYSFNISVAIWD
jgi:Tfp pilus assembly PilM family ATPase